VFVFGKQSAKLEPEVLAAVDLGSNSFHMVVARLSHGQLTVIDRLREMVQLASGLDEENRLNSESQIRALDCLSRFGERIRDMHANRVRVVGTNTLRRARGAAFFFYEAGERLGHPVELISGIEEARLIYSGSSHNLPPVEGSQIVLDIGGGSTEIIRGEGLVPKKLESLCLGCVSLSEEYFPNGRLTGKRFQRARIAAQLEFEPQTARFRGEQPSRYVGTSGTIKAVHRALESRGDVEKGITLSGVESLIDEMIDVGRTELLTFEDLSPQRRAVLPGGVVILAEAMRALRMDQLLVSEGSLREGILHDMVGRMTEEDARVRTVLSMEGRFNVDHDQASRVENTALYLLGQVRKSWFLDHEEDRQLLIWAARLHEVGLDIAHSRYQQHSAYLLEHADMPGFTNTEQQILACIVAGHRRAFDGERYGRLPGEWASRALRLTVILRFAVLFHRSRSDALLPDIILRTKGQKKISLSILPEWLDANSLTLAGLERERKYLREVGLQLNLLTEKPEV
jgi:exopolyphosphatase/guanosine-5'-triphosphate,3'-diphosphate pyrophosphatase